MEPIQIIFNFKGKDAEKGFKAILNDFQNLGFSPVGTKRAFLRNCYIFCYYVRVKQLPFTQDKKYGSHLEKKYVKILKEISVQKYRELDLEWTEDEIYEISQDHIDKFLNSFLRGIDNNSLEIVLTNLVLNSEDFLLPEDELISFGIEENSEPFVKLFCQEEKLSSKDVKAIFQLINTSDFILIKQIFHLILKKSKFTPKQIYDEYHKIKGKIPFERNGLNYIYAVEVAKEMSVLEMFFKDYILIERVAQDVRETYNGEREDIKVQIPFEIKGYNLEEKYSSTAVKIIQNFFLEKRELILSIFKMVLEHELKRIKVKFKGILVSFSYNCSEENIEKMRNESHFFDNLKTLYDNKLESFRRSTESGEINKFIIFRGHYIIPRNRIDFDWSREFRVRDINHQRILCKIIHNRTYFNELSLEIESEIELQGNLRVKYVYNKKNKTRKITQKYIEVIDINIIDNFKVINFHLGTHYNGDKWLENTKEGLSLYIYPMREKREADFICQTKIVHRPLVLLNIYNGQNEMFYEAKVNGEVICKPKKQLIEFLEERNLIIDESLVKKAVSNILRESIIAYDLMPKPMFNTIGIFLRDDDFVLVYGDDEYKRVIGENDTQKDLLDDIKEKELDKKGILTKIFYEIIHFPTLPLNVRLSILGYSAIHPFFFALSRKLDLLPNLFLIGKHGSGKTTTLRIFLNLLFGTKMMKSDDVRTEARLTKFLTQHLFVINIDDVDVIPEDQIGFIKTYSTERGTRNRMDNQKMNKEQMYASIAGSANSKDFLTQHDDQAFRLRCIVHEIKTNIQSNKENKASLRRFKRLHQELKESDKIYGHYLLSKALEFIDKKIKGNITLQKKMLKHFNQIYEQIQDYKEDHNVDLSDIRRITLYSLIYIGWEIWDYTFKTKGFESPILKEALNLKSGIFFDYLNELEKAELNLRLGVIENILEFFSSDYQNLSAKRTISKKPEKDGLIVFQTSFINKYDKWAKNHGYKILGSLTKLGEIQSEILNKDISPASIWFRDGNKGQKLNAYGLIFYYKKLMALRNNGNISQKEIDDNYNSLKQDSDVTGKIDMSKILVGKSRSSISKLDKLISRLNEIFEENGGEDLEKKNIIQILELEDSLDEKWIKDALGELIKDGTLYEPKENTINWPDKK